MTSPTNRQIKLASLPRGALSESNFDVADAPAAAPADGEVMLRTILVSLDAANRAWMQGATYRKALEGGQVMDGLAVSEVVESASDRLKPGDIVFGSTGWQTHPTVSARKVLPLPRDYRPLSHFISLLGIAGKTAYHGLMWIGEPKEGDTVVVSAAAGAVGSFVGQIAKIKGCRVIGIAGGPEKCAWLTGELGFDAAIDYKAEKVRKRLAELCPDGIDIFFDNVGGAILEAALFNMALFGRIVCCGAISQYDTTEAESPRGLPGILVFRRLKMQGYIMTDFADRDREAERDLAAWAAEGRLVVKEDILNGLEALPGALIGLLKGENVGKRMVRVGPDPA